METQDVLGAPAVSSLEWIWKVCDRELASGQGMADDVFEREFPIWEQGFLSLIT